MTADITREMLISHDTHETRVAILEDRRLVELYVERPKRSVVGNVYVGVVRDVLPGMQAAFVDIGLEKNAFLYVHEIVGPVETQADVKREIQLLVKPGQRLMVQVLKDPMGTKGARVTMDITLPGRYVVLMPFSSVVGISRKIPVEERERLSQIVEPLLPAGLGAIVRTAAATGTPEDLEQDIEFLLRLWKRVESQAREGLAPELIYAEMDLALRLVRDAFNEDYRALVVDDKRVYEKVVSLLKRTAPKLAKRVHLHREHEVLFDAYHLQGDIDIALQRTVPLPSGGYIAIDVTEALTAIDVNTGSFVGRRSLEDTVVRTNLEAAVEVVRQLRLRDIGGIIVIDFIDMEDAANRQRVVDCFTEAMQSDRTKTRVSEISRLGLLELTRKNVTDGLYGALTEPCPMCHGEGRVLSEATRRIMVERRLGEILLAGRSPAYLVGLHPETYALVNAPGRNALAMLRAESGKQLSVIVDPDAGPVEVRVLMEGKTGSVGLDTTS